MKTVLFVIAVTLGLACQSTSVEAASGCGFVPIKPLVPIGCSDLVPRCQCDEKGQKCHYIWVCVTPKS